MSTLTPSQLARKRANDREAQRAIRARTKEHIERLEKELDELRGQHSRDQTVQELLRRNQALEEELRRLKETMGVPLNTSPYSTPGTASATTSATNSSMDISNLGALDGTSSLTGSPFTVYDENMSTASARNPNSTRGSPFPNGYDGSLQDYGPSYVPLPDAATNSNSNNENGWNGVANAIPSNVSSPGSSAEEYSGTAYIPTSMPNDMMSTGGNGVVKMEYDDREHGMFSTSRLPLGRSFRTEETNCQHPDIGFPPHLNNNDLLHMQLQQQHQAMLAHSNTSSPDQPPRSMPWAATATPMFPMFFPQQQSPVH